jgi:Fe-Mn family superoxide dismutase
MNPLNTFTSALPYEFDALEPVLSKETVHLHFIQHHRRCYERTAAMVKETELESIPLESLVRVAGTQRGHRYLFTLAAEAWNHELYWRSLQPAGGGVASGPIGQDIQRTFGDFSTFLCRATEAARAVIGGGWLWVTWRGGRIHVISTGMTDSPILYGHVPLLAIDLCAHAYYLDYYCDRASYVSACLTRLIDWGQANERLLLARHTTSEAQESLRWVAWGTPAADTPTALPAVRIASDQIAAHVPSRRRDGIQASDCTQLVRLRGSHER